MPPHLGIVADDLTGAADSAVPFAARGWRTLVALSEACRVPSDADVVAVDTDSRGIGPASAGQQVRIAAARLGSLGATAWFKKVDSTLRGNVSAELGALMQAGDFRLAVLAPSFPANQRHVEDGWLLVGDPPQRRLQLVPLLASAFPGRVVAIRLRHVARGAPELAESLRAQVESAPLLALVDAMDDRDLETIVKAAELLGSTALLAGSGGLSAALAARMGTSGRARAAAPTPPGAVLVLVGSRQPHAREQLALLSRLRHVPVIVLQAGATGLAANALVEANRSLRAQRLALLATLRPPSSESRTSDDPGPARALASAALPLLDQRVVTGLVLTGGDTAAAVCRALGAECLDLGAEVLPGMPTGTLLGGRRPGLRLVTKSGGFGPPDALVRAVDALGATTEPVPSPSDTVADPGSA